MAKKKNSSTDAPIGVGSSGSFSLRVEPAENGSVVHCSGESGDGKSPEYTHKTFVARNHKEARRIALGHIATMGSNTKSSKGKKGNSKRKITKR